MAYLIYIIVGTFGSLLFFYANADYVHAMRDGCDHHAIQYLNLKLNSTLVLLATLFYLVRCES